MDAVNFAVVELAIAKLELAPSDILVIKVDSVDDEIRQRITAQVKSVLGDDGKVLVLDRTAEVSVLQATHDDDLLDDDDDEEGKYGR